MGKLHALTTSGRNALLLAGLTMGIVNNYAATVESTTESFVARAAVIQGQTGSRPQSTYLALSIQPSVAYVGTVSSIGPGTLTDTGASWQTDQFNGAQGSFYIEFASGLTADIADTSASTLSYPGTLPETVPAGSSYRIRRHLTLSDVFGPNNEAGLLPGQNGAEADNILLMDSETKESYAFFYSSVPGYPGWYRNDYTPAGNFVIYPEQGLIVMRRAPSNVVLYLQGQPLEHPLKVPVYAGLNFLGNLNPADSVRVDELGLYTGNPTTGLASGSNDSEADNLILINADSTTTTLFYSNYPGFEGWYDSAYAAAGQKVIGPGTAFFVKRKSPRSLFRWNVPLP